MKKPYIRPEIIVVKLDRPPSIILSSDSTGVTIITDENNLTGSDAADGRADSGWFDDISDEDTIGFNDF